MCLCGILPYKSFLFFLNVFQTVKRYCYQNDNTGEYELQVRIDTQDRQRVGQSGEDQHTDNNSGDLTDTTGKGYAANYAGCTSIFMERI